MAFASNTVRFVRIGILAGIIAGAIMLLYAMFASMTILNQGIYTPLYEMASPLIGKRLVVLSIQQHLYFTLGPASLGLVVHLVWAALYGVIFRFLVRTFQLPGAAAVLGGILYSLLVMLFMSFVVLPIVWLSEMPALVGWPSFTVEHLLFGLVLGFWPVLRPQDFAIAASQTSSITPVRGHPASLFSSREEAELLPPKQAGQPLRLEIYVSSECSNCQEALLIAEQARGIAGLEVDVVHIDDPDCLVPPSVFAVPTYILDGRVVSMGNPAREAFLAELRQRLRNA